MAFVWAGRIVLLTALADSALHSRRGFVVEVRKVIALRGVYTYEGCSHLKSEPITWFLTKVGSDKN